MSLIPQNKKKHSVALVAANVPSQETQETVRLLNESRAQIDKLAASQDKSLDARVTSLSRVDAAKLDPLQPLGNKKAEKPARRPPSPPAVRQRSPPRAEKKEEAGSWKIPAAISNWKNQSGNLVPLTDRVAASGGGVDRKISSVNRKFLDFASELYEAETAARTDAERRREAERLREAETQERREAELERLEAETRGKTEEISDSFSAARRELLKQTLKEHRSQRRGHGEKPEERISDHNSTKGDGLFDSRIFSRSAHDSSDALYQRPLFGPRQPLYAADRKRLADAKDQLDHVAASSTASGAATAMPVQFDTRPDVRGEADASSSGEDDRPAKRPRVQEAHDQDF